MRDAVAHATAFPYHPNMHSMFVALLLAAFSLPPAPATHVTDRAGVLGATASAIDQQLQDLEQRTSTQLVVYIDRKVPEGTTLEEFGAEAIRRWGVGQKEKDNGVILFLFTDDRQMRIEVGYGLEGTLTDAQSFRILQGMKPRLAANDYAGAVADGVNAIIQVISGAAPPAAEPEQMSIAEINALAEERTALPPIFYYAFGLLVLAIAYLVIRAALRGQLRLSSSGSSRSDSSGSGSSSSSSSSFRGGGGSGGGGGASSGW